MGNRRRVVEPAPELPAPSTQLMSVHARLFPDDVALVKKLAAEKGLPWGIELRLLVRRALKGERHEIVMLKE